MFCSKTPIFTSSQYQSMKEGIHSEAHRQLTKYKQPSLSINTKNKL
jgi:hypothetical protein